MSGPARFPERASGVSGECGPVLGDGTPSLPGRRGPVLGGPRRIAGHGSAGNADPLAPEFHGGASPALVGSLFEAEGHGAHPVSRTDAGEGFDHSRTWVVLTTVAYDGSDSVRGAQRCPWCQPYELFVRLSDGVAQHPVHGPLAAENREQTVSEPVVRSVLASCAGRRGCCDGGGPALVASACRPCPVHGVAPVCWARPFATGR